MMTKDEEIAELKARIATLEKEKEALEKEVLKEENSTEEQKENKKPIPVSREIFKMLASTRDDDKKVVSEEQREEAPLTPELIAMQQAQRKAETVQINEENKVSLSSRFYEQALKEMKESGRENFFDY